MIADPLWSCVMLLCGPLWVFCGSFVVLCGPLWVLCGSLRSFVGPLRSFAVLCGPMWSFVVLCGPLRSFAVFSHTDNFRQTFVAAQCLIRHDGLTDSWGR